MQHKKGTLIQCFHMFVSFILVFPHLTNFNRNAKHHSEKVMEVKTTKMGSGKTNWGTAKTRKRESNGKTRPNGK